MKNDLILAMGAEHTNPTRLHNIVKTIQMESNKISLIKSCLSKTHEIQSRDIIDRICDTYDCTFPRRWPIYDKVKYVMEEKFDGFSYVNDNGRFFSKRLSEAKDTKGQPIDKTGHIPHLSYILKVTAETFGCDLHGEIYIPGGISDNVTTILGCNEDEAVRRQWDNEDSPKLHYMIHDIRKYIGKSLVNEPYYVRRALLEYVYSFIKGIDKCGFIHLAEILEGDPIKQFKNIVQSGGEGLIFKRTDALYIPGKKPANNWVKAKRKITVDAVIIGYGEGTGKNKDLFGSIEFGLYVDGKLKKMGSTSSGLDDNMRLKIAENPDSYIGRVIELEAIQPSKNSFRNPVFLRLREDGDKSPEECTPLGIKNKEDLI